jgi:hypothetical protein
MKTKIFLIFFLIILITNIFVVSAQSETKEKGFFQNIVDWFKGLFGFSDVKEAFQFKIDKENKFIEDVVNIFKSRGVEGNYPSILVEENQDYWDFIESSLTKTDNYDLYVANYELNETRRLNYPDSFGWIENCKPQNSDEECERKKTINELYPYRQKVNLALVFDFKNNLQAMKRELMLLNDNLYQINSGNKGILYSTLWSCYIPYEQMERKYYDFNADNCDSIQKEILELHNNLIAQYGVDSESQCMCHLSNYNSGAKGVNVSCIYPKDKTKSCAYTSITYKIKFWTSENKIILLMFPTDEDTSKISHGYWASPYEIRYVEKYKPNNYPSILVPAPIYEGVVSKEGSYPKVIIEKNLGEFEYKPKTYYSKSEKYETYNANYKKGDSIYEVVVYKIKEGSIKSFMDDNPLTNAVLISKPSTNNVENSYILTTSDGEWNMWTSGKNIILIIYRGAGMSSLNDKKDLIKAYLTKYPSDVSSE